MVVPVALEKDVEQRDGVLDESLVVLLGCLGEARDAELREEVERIDHLLDHGDLVRLGLVEGVEELDGLDFEEEARR